MKFCENCGKELFEGDCFCMHCGHRVESQSDNQNEVNTDQKTIIEQLNEYIGNETPAKLNWRDLFSNVFQKHSIAEAEDIFTYGTRRTTPLLSEVSSTWPKPWLYSRVFVVLVVTFILLKICVDSFGNMNALPGLMAVGAFAMPLTTLVLFLEVNAFRNISPFYVAITFLIGGCASLVATLSLFTIISPQQLDFVGACIVGIVEELGKLIAVYLIIKRLPNCNFILNGLLVGAAVGAGFAAFESAGYAFTSLLQSGDTNYMVGNIYLRAFLSPGGHVAWAAITGAAIMIVKGNRDLTTAVLGDQRFWRLFLIPIALHSIWDMPIYIGSEICLVQLLLTAIVWIVVMLLINRGLSEVEHYKGN